MNIAKTDIDGIFLLDFFSFKDNRGEFVKTIHKETFEEYHLDYIFDESFYSVSKKNVLRGMHFQTPPADHAKLVYVVSGKILDVVVDLRQGPTFGQCYSVELSDENRKAVYIGKGFAHGFLALEENAIVEYHTTFSQSKEHEAGIRWDSFGFDWGIDNPVLSLRDQNFSSFDFETKYFL
jgi:dTDP-4-dehydrorhamnose 3,5-epimerase/CDP-3, 6-dideoxy-D-glycero-D-glycero-4-hexulose-5-epimerase